MSRTSGGFLDHGAVLLPETLHPTTAEVSEILLISANPRISGYLLKRLLAWDVVGVIVFGQVVLIFEQNVSRVFRYQVVGREALSLHLIVRVRTYVEHQPLHYATAYIRSAG